MAIPVRVPEIEHCDEGITVGDWLVEQGQVVDVGDHLVELILPGTVYVVSSEVSGELGGIVEHRGKNVGSGDVIAWVTTPELPSPENDPDDRGGTP
ncbi:MAG: hypothetical protein HUJ26_02775 [Planctomycetaceae bacterium]|nr:hypothetical protein [Planctomycetaceae bacterium]